MIDEQKLETPTAEYDSPWKNILEDFLQAFMEFCLPNVAKEIDWSKPIASLDKELTNATRGQKIGTRYVDKLFSVHLKNGTKACLHIHIDVQAQPTDDFPERMFIYRYRLFDDLDGPILSVAILADDDPEWRPTYYEHVSWNNRIYFEFETVKLLDYAIQKTLLLNHSNPFAIVIWAHLQALKTKKNPHERLRSRLHITRALLARGFDKEYIFKLYNFIAWVMALPEPLEIEYRSHVKQLEEKKKMRYLEYVYMKKAGAALILRLIKRRFGDVPDQYEQRIHTADAKTLRLWEERILDANTLQEMMEEEA